MPDVAIGPKADASVNLLITKNMEFLKSSVIINCTTNTSGWDSGNSDSLRARRPGDRIPVGGRFSAPVQTRTGAHPASCTVGTGFFTGVKQLGHGIDRPPPSSAKVKE